MAKWTWDAARREYVSDTGLILGKDELQAIRDGLADGFEEVAADLVARHASGALPDEEFAGQFRAFVDEAMRAQFLLGRGGVNACVGTDFETMAKLIADQLGFAEGFAADLAAKQLTQVEATARAELYAGATVSAFEQGMAATHDGLDLPAFPGDGATQCLGNCRCRWEIVEFDDRYEATWIAEQDPNSCDDCLRNSERWSPFVQMKTTRR
jgi:hypothetical protein